MELPSPKDSTCILNALYVEHNVQRIITQQEINGVFYNKARGRFYVHVLRERKNQLSREVRPFLSLQYDRPYSVPISRPFLKAGGYSNSVKAWFEDIEHSECVSGPFTRVQYREPNLGSRIEIIAQLLRAGWKPKAFTPKGNPKLTVDGQPCDSLLRISEGFGRDIAEWYVLNHRESQVLGFDKRVREDGRISAEAITIGTPTFRFRHKGVVNVPRSTTLFGKQIRSLFGAPKGRAFVGYDAKGLELRILAHYLEDEAYYKVVTEGDPHLKNQEDAELPTKDDAKTFIYAFIYGAGDGKIGSIIGKGAAGGRALKRRFLSKNPKLEHLVDDFKKASRRGYLIGIDGRRLEMRRDKNTGKPQDHKALNTALQGGGAVVMKYALCYLDSWIHELRLDALKVIDMHDEGQEETSIEHAHITGQLGCLAIEAAGKHLKLNLPLAGDYKVGQNWSHTH
jgi:DNA polymerase-1